ncbi:hypothetical protein CN491_15715 [Bacillus cereus]|uniref:Uncharacterized protein n=1 Tax=Bacillus cereus TaxID=1396 RepID=A0A2A8LN36_BACCE|nr:MULTISPECIES: hypothetical protein [Bacillus cereus group]MDM5236576.1 hypothetical protein [Bacillus cereus]MEA1010440.1 hypothetical protein [Bacillus cereus]PES94934.1 hypothetical protein CN491_15715 [Bacillus cereus]PFP74800.1 hypothetical protein COJ95_19925 [Bacillus cereus]PGT13398.1 hypothetical protein COC96_24690 [Bacillus cereus]
MALFFLFAKEVRTQPLNIEEKASADVKTMDINEEMRIKKRQCRYTSPLSRYHLLLSPIIIVILSYLISYI